MSLSYFTIFNPSMGPDEDSLPDQLIFYTSATTSDLDTQLRNIGLVQGIVELGRSFSKPEAGPIHCIKSRDTRVYLFEVEAGFWVVVCLASKTEDGIYIKDMPPALQICRQISLAHKQFVLENNALKINFERNSREEAIKIIESWWIRWVWAQNFLYQDAINLADGLPQSQVELSRHGKQEIKAWIDELLKIYRSDDLMVSIVLEDGYVWSPSAASSSPCIVSNANCLYQCVRQHVLQQQQKESPRAATGIDEADKDVTNYAWLSSNKWSTETARLFSNLSFKNKTSVSDTVPETQMQVDGFRYKDFRTFFMQRAAQDDSLCETNINIFRFNTAYIIVSMDSDVSADWSHLETLLAQAVPRFPHHLLKAKPANPPLFYSLTSDATTGKTYSNLPSLANALSESTADSVLQRQVKENTIHLHRQIYEICSRNVPESVVKTAKNIWIIVRRDSQGLIVLCKSSKSGETMEEIEREAQLWMTRLRSSHRSAIP